MSMELKLGLLALLVSFNLLSTSYALLKILDLKNRVKAIESGDKPEDD